jgi:hypothetical protein
LGFFATQRGLCAPVFSRQRKKNLNPDLANCVGDLRAGVRRLQLDIHFPNPCVTRVLRQKARQTRANSGGFE